MPPEYVERAMRLFIQAYTKDYEQLMREHVKHQWNYSMNMTTENAERAQNSTQRLAHFKAEGQTKAQSFVPFYRDLLNTLEIKQLEEILQIGEDSLLSASSLKNGENSKFSDLSRLKAEMIHHLKSATFQKLNHSAVTTLLKESYSNTFELENPTEYYFTLREIWHGFLTKVGRESKDKFIQLVELVEDSASRNGFLSATEEQLNKYGNKTHIMETVGRTWNEILPLYEKLHAVVRFNLQNVYGDRLVKSDGAIPAHLVSDLFSQSWKGLYELVQPNPSARFLPQQIDSNIIEMVQHVDNYFSNIGFERQRDTFFTNSKFIQTGYQMACDETAWDFQNGAEYRISMCAKPTRDDVHEMVYLFAQMNYFRAYSPHPILLRGGANPAFPHAFAEAIKLSASQFDQYSKLSHDEGSHLNFLMELALDKLPFLAFAKSLEDWRWDIYDGVIKSKQFQVKWDEYRFTTMGLQQPLDRDVSDLDAAAKFHVIAYVDYIRYYLAAIMQFQVLGAVCPGNEINCDLRISQKSGAILRSAMGKGKTASWPSVLYDLTGQREISASALLKFFAPLESYLDSVIAANNLPVGWKKWKPPSKRDMFPRTWRNNSDIGVTLASSLTFLLSISLLQLLIS